MKTDVIIKVSIKHDTAKCKRQALNSLVEGLKKGLSIKGINGNGEKFELEVTKRWV
jgi:hypothetical protein